MALMSLAKLTLCVFALSTALDVDGTCANGGSCAKKSTTQTSQLSAEGPVVDIFGLIQSTHTLAQRMSGNLNITPTDLPKEDTAQNTGQPTAQKQRALDVIEKATTRFSMEKLMQFNTSIREMRQMFASHFTPENQAVIQEVIDALAKHLEENVKRDQNSAKGKVVTRIADLTEKTNSVVAQKTESDDADTSHSTCVTEEVRLLTAHKTCTDEETQLTTDKPTNEFCGNPILKPVVYQNSPDLIAYLSNDISIDYSKDIADINAELAAHAAEVNRLMNVWIDAQKLIAVTEKGNWETYNQKCIDITKDLADKTAECGEKLAAWQLQHEKCLHEKSAQQMSLCAFGYKYQMKCDSKIEYETTRDGIQGTGTVLSEPDREQEFTHFNRIMCVLDTFKTTIEFDSGAVDACTESDDQAADKFTAEVGRIDLQEDEYETLTSEAKFTCNEAQITFGNGDLWTVPENTDGVAGWLPTADDYSKVTGDKTIWNEPRTHTGYWCYAPDDCTDCSADPDLEMMKDAEGKDFTLSGTDAAECKELCAASEDCQGFLTTKPGQHDDGACWPRACCYFIKKMGGSLEDPKCGGPAAGTPWYRGAIYHLHSKKKFGSQGYAYAINSDPSNAPFEFCLGSGDHPTAPTCGSAYDCSAGSGSAKPATTPCHLDGGCTSADCCEGMFPAPEVTTWVLGVDGATCDATCAKEGKVCDAKGSATLTSWEKIQAVLEQISEAGKWQGEPSGERRHYAGAPFCKESNGVCVAWDGGEETICDGNDAGYHRPICSCAKA